MEERILYFDCFSGISGDMTIAALLDLGIDHKEFMDELEKINISGYAVEVNNGLKNGISGTDFNVTIDHKHDHHHRNLNDIKKIIHDSELNNKVKNISENIFTVLAEAESKVHNKTVDEIHFHEVGAIDSIVDIIGTAICIDILSPDRILSSPLHLGSGFVKCAHGTLPVPAPATMELLSDIPVYSTGIKSELVTPTGAAIIKVLCDDFVSLPALTIEKSGYGLGKRELEIPNLLRVIKGCMGSVRSLVMLETNIDNMSPEIYSHLMPVLFDAGARDVFITNIVMKKNRPGIKLSVLCDHGMVQGIEDLIFKETTTLGIRKYKVERQELEREFREIETRFGPVKVKFAYKDGQVLKYAPEYEDCKKIAEQNNMPVKDVFQEVIREVGKEIKNPLSPINRVSPPKGGE